MKTKDLLRLRVTWGLGTIGVKSADGSFYADLFWGGFTRTLLNRTLRSFVHDQVVGARRWYTLTWNGWELDKVEQTDPEAFARVCRRTMQPYREVQVTINYRPEGWPVEAPLECFSYPFVEKGRAQVMLRQLGECGELMQVDCEDVRPIDWRRCTGVPANDPVCCLEGRAS